jgi:hypothetical protein
MSVTWLLFLCLTNSGTSQFRPGNYPQGSGTGPAGTVDKRSDRRIILYRPASLRSERGRLCLEWLATFPWTGWQTSVEYAYIHIESLHDRAVAPVGDDGCPHHQRKETQCASPPLC